MTTDSDFAVYTLLGLLFDSEDGDDMLLRNAD
jgi:hypothetical protein